MSDSPSQGRRSESRAGWLAAGLCALLSLGGTGLAGSQGQAGPGFHDQRQSGEGDRDAVNHLCQRRWRDVPADVKWAGLFARCKKEVRRVASRMGGTSVSERAFCSFLRRHRSSLPSASLLTFFFLPCSLSSIQSRTRTASVWSSLWSAPPTIWK